MKRKLILYLGTIVAAIIVSLWMTSCENEDQKMAVIGAPFKISNGEFISIADSSHHAIGFETVVENSLCPQDVVCIRQGNFTMIISFRNSDYELSLGDLGLPNEVIVDGYKIQLEEILYPTKINDEVDANHPTTVRLLVEKI